MNYKDQVAHILTNVTAFADEGYCKDNGEERFYALVVNAAREHITKHAFQYVQTEQLLIRGKKHAEAVMRWRTKNDRQTIIQDAHLCEIGSKVCRIERVVDNIYGCKASGIIHICTRTQCRRVFQNATGELLCVFSNASVGVDLVDSSWPAANRMNAYVVHPDEAMNRLSECRLVPLVDNTDEGKRTYAAYIDTTMKTFIRQRQALIIDASAARLFRSQSASDVINVSSGNDTQLPFGSLVAFNNVVNPMLLNMMQKKRRVMYAGRSVSAVSVVSDAAESVSSFASSVPSTIDDRKRSKQELTVITSDLVLPRRKRATPTLDVEDSATLLVFTPSRGIISHQHSTSSASVPFHSPSTSPVAYEMGNDDAVRSAVQMLVRVLYDTAALDNCNNTSLDILYTKTASSAKRMFKRGTVDQVPELVGHIVTETIQNMTDVTTIPHIDQTSVAFIVDTWTEVVIAVIRMVVTLSTQYHIKPRTFRQDIPSFALSILYMMQDGIVKDDILVVPVCPVLKHTLPSQKMLHLFQLGSVLPHTYREYGAASRITLCTKSIMHVIDSASTNGCAPSDISLFTYVTRTTTVLDSNNFTQSGPELPEKLRAFFDVC